jgi:hypothetical protein
LEKQFAISRKRAIKIIIKYKISDERRREQDIIIGELENLGLRLLNKLREYNYKKANKKEELKKIREYCDDLITNNSKLVDLL